MMMKKQQGIALIQVLLITAVLTVLAMYLTNTAKDQITIARWADDKALALVALHSAEAELIFTLLTEPKIIKPNVSSSQESDSDKIITRWNFFARPFTIGDEVMVTIQDQAGLINAHFPNRKILSALIAAQGFSLSEVNTLVDSLLDWQDLDNIPRINGAESEIYSGNIRNGAVPDVHDFLFVNQMTPQLHQSLLANTTIYKKGTFNPTSASQELLNALTNKTVAGQVIQLRDNNQLTNVNFSQLTGIVEDDETTFYPSNYLAIKLSSKVGESNVHKNTIIQIMPYATAGKQPINTYSNRG